MKLDNLKLEDTIRFEPIKERRDAYFVEYSVPLVNYRFATLALVFVETREPEQVAKAMEEELAIWLRRYPVPIMVSSFEDTEALIHLEPSRAESHIIGWTDAQGRTQAHWRLVKDEEIPCQPFTITRLIEVYADVPYKISTAEDKRRDLQETAGRYRAMRNIVLVWFVGIPIGIALFMQFVAWAGWVATGFSVLAGIWRLAGIMGWRKKSKRQLEKEAEELRMKHHHYWCERNPEGFNRLKFEAMDRETRERVRKGAEESERKSK